MRILTSLCRAQCRCVARLGTAGSLLAVFVAVVAQLAAGAPPGHVLSVQGLATTLAAILPELLAVVLPLALAQCLLSLEESGEREALSAAGVRPHLVVLAVGLPLLPLLVVLHLLVHEARPAARMLGRQAAVGSAEGVWRGLEGAGLGRAAVGPGLHALLPLGDAVLAVAAARAEATPRGTGLSDGVVHLVEGGSVGRAEFAAARLALAPLAVGLDQVDSADLSTRFLTSSAVRWQRARLRWHGVRSVDVIAAELARRRWAVPAAGLALLVAGLALGGRRRLGARFVYGVCAPPAVAVALFLGRVLP